MRRVFLVMAACCVMASPAFAGGGVDLYLGYGEVIDGDYDLGLGAPTSVVGVHVSVTGSYRPPVLTGASSMPPPQTTIRPSTQTAV